MNGARKKLWLWTPGERLWLLRRRHALPRPAFAALLGVCATTLWRLETDQRALGRHAATHVPPAPRALNRGDLCALARWRSGAGLRETAAAMGCSHVTYLAAEEIGMETVVEHWRARGFRFPQRLRR